MRNTVSFCAAFLAAVATVRCDSRSAPIAPTDAGTVSSGGGGAQPDAGTSIGGGGQPDAGSGGGGGQPDAGGAVAGHDECAGLGPGTVGQPSASVAIPATRLRELVSGGDRWLRHRRSDDDERQLRAFVENPP